MRWGYEMDEWYKKLEKDPEYWKEYVKAFAEEFDIVQKRVLELESAMQMAVDHLEEADHPLYDTEISIIDEFERLLKEDV